MAHRNEAIEAAPDYSWDRAPESVESEIAQLTFTEAKQLYTVLRGMRLIQAQFQNTRIAAELNLSSVEGIMDGIEHRQWDFDQLMNDSRETTDRRRARNGYNERIARVEARGDYR